MSLIKGINLEKRKSISRFDSLRSTDVVTRTQRLINRDLVRESLSETSLVRKSPTRAINRNQ